MVLLPSSLTALKKQSAMVWFDQKWHKVSSTGQASTQRAELKAAIMALHHFSHQPANLVADLQYVVYVIQNIEQASIKELTDFSLLSSLL